MNETRYKNIISEKVSGISGVSGPTVVGPMYRIGFGFA